MAQYPMLVSSESKVEASGMPPSKGTVVSLKPWMASTGSGLAGGPTGTRMVPIGGIPLRHPATGAMAASLLPRSTPSRWVNIAPLEKPVA
jgi:hypothetical protein